MMKILTEKYSTILVRLDEADVNKEGACNIPEEVTSIGLKALSGQHRLRHVTIPENVTSIHFRALASCRALRTITLPASINFISKSAFSGSPNLHSIVIDSGVGVTINRITALLSRNLQTMVVPIELAEVAYQIQAEQLSRLNSISELNPLFRFFNSASRAENCPAKAVRTLPDDVFVAINPFVGSDSIYVLKVQMSMQNVPLPKDKKKVAEYRLQLEAIVDDCICKAKEFNAQKGDEFALEQYPAKRLRSN